MRRELCAASRVAASTGCNGRLGKSMIDFIDQKPGAAIRHPDFPGAGGYRSGFADRFKECDFAGADPLAVRKVNSDAETGFRHRR